MLQNKFATLINQLKSHEIYNWTFDLSEIKIVSLQELEIKDKLFKIKPAIFEKLMKFIGIKKEDYQKNDDKRVSQMNESQTINILNHLRKCIAMLGKKNVSISFNKMGEIVSVGKENIGDLNFVVAANVTEDLVNNLPVKDLSRSTISPDGFIVSFTENQEFNIKGFKDEYYRVGKTIEFKTGFGFEVQSYIERMICTNGMYGFVFAEKAYINRTNECQGLMAKVQKFNHASFIDRLTLSIESHHQHVMSARELYQVEKFMNHTMQLSKNETVQSFLDTKSVSKILREQMKNKPKELDSFMRTPFNSWEMINKLTYIGSHTQDFDIHENTGFLINKFASNILTDRPDIEEMRLPKQIF